MAPGQGDENKTHTLLEHVDFSDESDDEYPIEELKDDDDDAEIETLDDINRLLNERKMDADEREAPDEEEIVKVKERPQVIDDFIRNFLMQYDMKRSLDAFQTEWYELMQSGKFKPSEMQTVPDDYARGQCLLEDVMLMRNELEKARMVAEKAKETWDKFRKERDFHRMHHRRVVQEKNKLIIDLKRLKRHYEQYEPTLTELRHKYEVAMKEKMLMRLERDRFSSKVESLQKQLTQMQFDSKEEPLATKDMLAEESTRRTRPREAPWPSEDRTNPNVNSNYEASRVHEYKKFGQPLKHAGAVSRVAFHPKIPVVGTCSDDHTWKMWSLPEGNLVLSGEGHKDWVSGIAFHPRGSLIATTSGDGTAKIWDVEKEKCKHTLSDHTQAVWSCAFHDLGDFMVTSSMDQTCKAFDMQSMRCRQTFRGHVDSVNYVTFQPCSNNVLTASGDKTVSLWDLRQGLCVQTFYGHANCCNQANFSLKGDTIASCDSDGIVKLWDVRKVCEYLQIDTGQHPANSSVFDRSGKVLAIASGDVSVKIFNIEDKAWLTNHESHDDAVNDVAFGQNDKYMVTASSDGTCMMYQ